MARFRRAVVATSYWPSFVDVLTNLLLVFIFLLSVFAVVQFLLARELNGKGTILDKLNGQVDELTSMLALEKVSNADLTNNAASLQASLTSAGNQRDSLQAQLGDRTNAAASASDQIAALSSNLDNAKQVSQTALAQVDLLNQQIDALRTQLAALNAALGASEAKNTNSQAQIADLGQQLNAALAQSLDELTRYRSDFFGRLNQIIGTRPDIQVVGDRFVFQSEVLFDTNSDVINPAGLNTLNELATAVTELTREIPADLPWVLSVDGFTDKRPILGTGGPFRSNWELSAARAISVVQFLVSKGIPPDRLVAAGFGEFQPLDNGDSDAALAKNRRIELKLTTR